MSDLFPESGPTARGNYDIAATYDYRDEHGKPLFQVVRMVPKKFFQRREDGKGGWINRIGNTRKVLFRLPELLAADPVDPVFVVEGEKDVLALERLGFVATTNPMGAGKWRREYSEYLRSRHVVLIPDNDAPGREHVEKVALALQETAASIKVVELPDLPRGGDVSDWLSAGGTPDGLRQLAAATPDWLAPRQPDFPDILVTGRPLREITRDALGALYARNDPLRLFRRAGRICRVQEDEKGRPTITNLDEYGLRGEMDRSANFQRRNKNGELTPVAPPMDVVKDALSQPHWQFPALDAIIQAPALRPDGTCIDVPGYDPATGLYYQPEESLRVPTLSDVPSGEEVARAIALVHESVAEFPHLNDAGRAHTMALLLTPVVRPAIEGPVPLCMIDAPTKGTGKTLLAEVAATIAVGRAEHMGGPRREEEWQKLITSALAEGTTFLVFDNLRGTIQSAALERVLTAGHWSDRVLGHTRMVKVEPRGTWVVTANNAQLGGDLARRCYRVRLDARMARPWIGRRFRHPDLLQWVREHRGELLWALLTLARSWFAAGCPESGTPRIGKFESWSEVVGGILSHAGVTGFLSDVEAMYDEMDEGDKEWEGFLRAWFEVFQSKPVTVSALVERLFPPNGENQAAETLRKSLPEELVEVYDGDGDRRRRVSFSRKLGRALSTKRDRRFGTDGVHLEKAEMDSDRHANAWRVVLDDGSPEVPEVAAADPGINLGIDPALIPPSPPTLPGLPASGAADRYETEERQAIQGEGTLGDPEENQGDNDAGR